MRAPRRRFFRPTWVEVDLGLLRSNLRLFKSRLGRGVKLLFVVKANAYGHGASDCALAAQKARTADCLGVSSVEEGVALRDAGLRLPILVLGSLYPFESFLAGIEYGLIPTVASLESARRLAAVGEKLGRKVRCHLKVETGMGRIGVSPGACVEVARTLSRNKFVVLEGVYTHLSCADSNRSFTKAQLARFDKALGGIQKAGIDAGIRHAANSAGALRHREGRYDMVRPGLAIYGLVPGFDPVLSLKTRVVFIKNVRRGAPISYGATYRAPRPSRIATLPVGYADGYSRRLSNRASVLLHGRRCPVVGSISMDMMMVDVTRIPGVLVGDTAVLIGRQGKAAVTVGDIAHQLGTIPYEVTTGIAARVPRVYLA